LNYIWTIYESRLEANDKGAVQGSINGTEIEERKVEIGESKGNSIPDGSEAEAKRQ
jgi:hypothetical protein